MFFNFKVVPRVIFGRGCFSQLKIILSKQRKVPSSIMIFLIDDVFKKKSLAEQIPLNENDIMIWINVDNEPTTTYVDELTLQIKQATSISYNTNNISGIIGIGGGSTLDLTKAVSLMLTNIGTSTTYQGWDLIENPGIYHIGIPTLSGTGAEISRTCVLTGPEKKLGINSDYTIFDQIILDPDMTRDVPKLQRFYTGMDCYIHCVESLNGTFINAFSQAYGEKSMELCQEVFLENATNAESKLMMASYFGGMSIAYSQVGICHALSYGLSFVRGIHHGLSNCMIFKVLEEFYPEGVQEFHHMMAKQEITLPEQILPNLTAIEINKMIDIALSLEPLWENALGRNWKSLITRTHLHKIYSKI